MPYEKHFKATKDLEKYLESTFGATGHSMHEKIKSVEDRLSAMELCCYQSVADLTVKLHQDPDHCVKNIPQNFFQLCCELKLQNNNKKKKLLLTPKTEPNTDRDRPSKENHNRSVTVEQLSKTVQISPEALVSQLSEAGVAVKSKDDWLSEEDKLSLLIYLRSKKTANVLKGKVQSNNSKDVQDVQNIALVYIKLSNGVIGNLRDLIRYIVGQMPDDTDPEMWDSTLDAHLSSVLTSDYINKLVSAGIKYDSLQRAVRFVTNDVFSVTRPKGSIRYSICRKQVNKARYI